MEKSPLLSVDKLYEQFDPNSWYLHLSSFVKAPGLPDNDSVKSNLRQTGYNSDINLLHHKFAQTNAWYIASESVQAPTRNLFPIPSSYKEDY